ncbi:hypothetical protein F4859DRAFT_528365 [Xylaria cf. heliscus]|nr:hypothetical protein F4859DRAFT_528365 [Xylaria cf. heliscus]
MPGSWPSSPIRCAFPDPEAVHGNNNDDNDDVANTPGQAMLPSPSKSTRMSQSQAFSFHKRQPNSPNQSRSSQRRNRLPLSQSTAPTSAASPDTSATQPPQAAFQHHLNTPPSFSTWQLDTVISSRRASYPKTRAWKLDTTTATTATQSTRLRTPVSPTPPPTTTVHNRRHRRISSRYSPSSKFGARRRRQLKKPQPLRENGLGIGPTPPPDNDDSDATSATTRHMSSLVGSDFGPDFSPLELKLFIDNGKHDVDNSLADFIDTDATGEASNYTSGQYETNRDKLSEVNMQEEEETGSKESFISANTRPKQVRLWRRSVGALTNITTTPIFIVAFAVGILCWKPPLLLSTLRLAYWIFRILLNHAWYAAAGLWGILVVLVRYFCNMPWDLLDLPRDTDHCYVCIGPPHALTTYESLLTHHGWHTDTYSSFCRGAGGSMMQSTMMTTTRDIHRKSQCAAPPEMENSHVSQKMTVSAVLREDAGKRKKKKKDKMPLPRPGSALFHQERFTILDYQQAILDLLPSSLGIAERATLSSSYSSSSSSSSSSAALTLDQMRCRTIQLRRDYAAATSTVADRLDEIHDEITALLRNRLLPLGAPNTCRPLCLAWRGDGVKAMVDCFWRIWIWQGLYTRLRDIWHGSPAPVAVLETWIARLDEIHEEFSERLQELDVGLTKGSREVSEVVRGIRMYSMRIDGITIPYGEEHSGFPKFELSSGAQMRKGGEKELWEDSYDNNINWDDDEMDRFGLREAKTDKKKRTAEEAENVGLALVADLVRARLATRFEVALRHRVERFSRSSLSKSSRFPFSSSSPTLDTIAITPNGNVKSKTYQKGELDSADKERDGSAWMDDVRQLRHQMEECHQKRYGERFGSRILCSSDLCVAAVALELEVLVLVGKAWATDMMVIEQPRG